MQLNIHDAKTQFSKLIAAVERGEAVTICRAGKPIATVQPIRSGTYPFGRFKGVWPDLPDAAFDALPDEELDEMGL